MKLCRAGRVNEQHGVSHDSLPFTAIFLPEFQHSFLSLHSFAFCSFTLCILHPVLFFPSRLIVRRFTIFYFLRGTLFLFFHDTLCLAAFKMGVKSVPTITIFPCSPRCLSFVASQYLCLYRDVLLLLFHDIFDFTAMPTFPRLRQDSLFLHRCLFCCATILLISPRCHLWLLHNIFVFTAIPSFVAPRYFRFHHDTIFLKHHDTFGFARTPFARTTLTPACAAAGARQSLIEDGTLKLAQHENHASAPAVRTTHC